MFVFKIIWDYNSEIISTGFLYFGIVMVLLIVVNYFIYMEVAKITERSKVLMVQDGMRETLELMINDIRMRQHEYKNHLTTIQGFVDTNEPPEAIELLRTYLDDVYTVDALDADLLSIDRNIIKAIMFTKKNEAQNRGIEFDFKVNTKFKDVKVLDYELSTILNNLLNNAFEAVMPLDEKRVELELGFDEQLGLHYFKTINKSVDLKPEMLPKLTERNFTTKKYEKGTHGFGLWSITNIVKKYRGLVYVYFDQEDIVFKVTFQ